ncbi:MAG: triose-phosphate isomerase, partial [Alphaproteobacteria bacterium]
NWKMNGLQADGADLARRIVAGLPGGAPETVLCPPATLLAAVARVLNGSAIALGGQDCHAAASGPHTGDIAAVMLADLGCRYVIVGHSERRSGDGGHGESDGNVLAKAAAAQAAGLTAIVCIGESAAENTRGETLEVLSRQVAQSVPPDSGASSLVVAYEPVWAIGSGRTPDRVDVERAHGAIRRSLHQRIGAAAADVRLLYGGSVKPGNTTSFVTLPEVDGVLVGGASLVAEDFIAICRAAGGQSAG